MCLTAVELTVYGQKVYHVLSLQIVTCVVQRVRLHSWFHEASVSTDAAGDTCCRRAAHNIRLSSLIFEDALLPLILTRIVGIPALLVASTSAT